MSVNGLEVRPVANLWLQSLVAQPPHNLVRDESWPKFFTLSKLGEKL